MLGRFRTGTLRNTRTNQFPTICAVTWLKKVLPVPTSVVCSACYLISSSESCQRAENLFTDTGGRGNEKNGGILPKLIGIHCN